MKVCSEAGQIDVGYLNSVQRQKVQGDECNDECEWRSKLLKENKTAFAGCHKNGTLLFSQVVVDVDGHDIIRI